MNTSIFKELSVDGADLVEIEDLLKVTINYFETQNQIINELLEVNRKQSENIKQLKTKIQSSIKSSDFMMEDSVTKQLVNKIHILETEVAELKKEKQDLIESSLKSEKLDINQNVICLYKSGVNKSDIARRIGLSRSKVYRIIKKHEEIREKNNEMECKTIL